MSPVHPFSIGVLHLIIEIVRFVIVIVWFIVLEVFHLVTATCGMLVGLVVGSVGCWSGWWLGVPWLIEVGGFTVLVL